MQVKPFNGIEVPREWEHKPSVPPAQTPAPQRNKVAGIPTREPVNKQAALLLSPIRCWLSKPLPPQKLPDPRQAEVDALKADLKIERNNHALTRDDLGVARAKIRELTALAEKQQRLIEALQKQLAHKDGLIRQLEDLKL